MGWAMAATDLRQMGTRRRHTPVRLSGMKTFRSPWLAALAMLLIVVGVAGLMARPTFASPFAGRAFFGPPWQNGGDTWDRSAIPPQLAGLADVPANERFDHFRGVQVQLTDKDG